MVISVLLFIIVLQHYDSEYQSFFNSIVSFIKDRALLKTTLLIKLDQKGFSISSLTLWSCAVCTNLCDALGDRYCNTIQPLNDQFYEIFVVDLCESSKNIWDWNWTRQNFRDILSAAFTEAESWGVIMVRCDEHAFNAFSLRPMNNFE